MNDHEKLLEEWKERLGLHDWVIVLNDKRKPEEMLEQDVSGCCNWDEVNKAARIDIIDPFYYGRRVIPFNWEKTLVHELLHIKLCLVSDGYDTLWVRYMHQIIDDLARAFVGAKRSGGDGDG